MCSAMSGLWVFIIFIYPRFLGFRYKESRLPPEQTSSSEPVFSHRRAFDWRQSHLDPHLALCLPPWPPWLLLLLFVWCPGKHCCCSQLLMIDAGARTLVWCSTTVSTWELKSLTESLTLRHQPQSTIFLSSCQELLIRASSTSNIFTVKY